MKRIVMIGSSIAVVAAIEKIRETDRESAITLICFEGGLPYRQDFSAYFSRNLKDDELFVRPAGYYADNNVRVVSDKKIVRINFNKRRIFLEDKDQNKDQLDYDVLVMSEVADQKLPDIRGINKTGCFNAGRLKDIYTVRELVPIVHGISVQSPTLRGLELAMSIARKGKDVYFVAREHTALSAIDPELLVEISKIWADKQLFLILENQIDEVLGDSDAKAIRLKSGKVIASDVIIFSETTEDLRILFESPLTLLDKVVVNESFETGLENVYVLDGLIRQEEAEETQEVFKTQTFLENQGRCVGAKITGGEYTPQEPGLFAQSISFEGVTVEQIGRTQMRSDHQIIERTDIASLTFKRLYLKSSVVQGAIVVNGGNESVKIRKLIDIGISIENKQEGALDPQVSFEELQAEPKETPQPAVFAQKVPGQPQTGANTAQADTESHVGRPESDG